MWFLYLLAFLLLGLFITVFDILFFIMLFSSFTSARAGAPFVPIPKAVAKEALKMANLSKNDILYDLGSGEGRVTRMAVCDFNVKKAAGFEIALWPHLTAEFKNIFLKKNVSQRIENHHDNFFKANLLEASVVYLYLFPSLLEKLKEKMVKELPQDARIICCRYKIKDWVIKEEKMVDGIHIYLYENPAGNASRLQP